MATEKADKPQTTLPERVPVFVRAAAVATATATATVRQS